MKSYVRRLSAGLLALVVAGQFWIPAAARALDGRTVRSDEVRITETFSDPKLQAWLLDKQNLGGAGEDGVLTLEERRGITELRISGLGLNSLDGLEAFFNLQVLNCSRNNLTELDLSGNPELTELDCSYNQLTRLDLTQSPHLAYVTCRYNQLTQLDCSGKDQMIALNCEMNQLTQLNLSGCTALKSLYCRNNSLTELNLRDNTALEFIETFSNYLTGIEVGHLSKLRFLHIDHNYLTQLDLRGLQNLEGGGFVARNNHMETIYLPNQPGLTIYLDDYALQDPVEGSDRVSWYLDPTFQTPVTGDLEAEGQILYSQRIPNRYTIYFSANGGSGSMDKVTAQWGEPLTLSPNRFVRSGYTFSHWSVLANDRTYADQQQVLNLAGRNTDGDHVTLYAQWDPNSYSIHFDANGGIGGMEDMDAVYGQPVILRENQFTNGGLEFAGWSLTPDGAVRYPNLAQVQNLTALPDERVTLYAVWRTPLIDLQKPYLAKVEAAFQEYAAAGDELHRYTAQDWSDLCAAYARAVSGIQQSVLPENMESAQNQGLREMSQIPTIADRIGQVTTGWKNAHNQALAYLGTPSLDTFNASEVEQLVQGALNGLEQDQLDRYCPLTQEGDRAQVLGAAAAELQPVRESLLTLGQAAQWLCGLGDLPRRPLAQVYGENLADYQGALSAYEALDQQWKAHMSAQVFQALNLRCELASQKSSSTHSLQQQYESLDLTAYSQESQTALAQALSRGLEAIRTAASGDAVQEAHRQAWDSMMQIPTQDQAPVTPPGSGDTGTGGGNPGGGNTGDGNTGGGTPGGGTPGGGSGGSGGGSAGGEVTVSYTVTAMAHNGGSISPSGEIRVTEGGSRDFTVTPDAGYRIHDVWVDGKSVGPVSHYTFSSVTADHTIEAYFETQTQGEVPGEDNLPFDDVPTGVWYESAVTYAYQNGLMQGTGGNHFAPETHLSRAMLVQILYNLEQGPESVRTQFPDVAEGEWYTQAIAWAAEHGIVSGYDNGTFGPDDWVTREQLALILYRYTQYKGYDTAEKGDLSAFQDGSSTSEWAEEALVWAVGYGVMAGKGGGTLDPIGTATRAEVAQMLMNYLNVFHKK